MFLSKLLFKFLFQLTRSGNAEQRVLFFGVGIPIIAILAGLTATCLQESYVDPVPTLGHATVLLLVPLSNYLILGRKSLPQNKLLPNLFCGMATAISAVYAIIFAPLVFCIVATLPVVLLVCFWFPAFILMVLLMFGPMFALFSCIQSIHHLRKNNSAITSRVSTATMFAGAIFAVSLLLAIHFPHALAQMALTEAVGADAQSSRAGIRLLRALGSTDLVLRACYPSWSGRDPITTTDTARKVFYRLTGKEFNEVPRPNDVNSNWSPDSDRAASKVGGRVKDLSLSSSVISGTVHPEEAIGHLQWTMTFRNKSRYEQQEARALLALPPGAVVSETTLWINGVPTHGVFVDKQSARNAYTRVVAYRRDPLLVTSAGKDQVLAQCFPVPPRNYLTGRPGEMKIRLDITVPLMLPKEQEASLMLPRLAERNFDIATKHYISLTSTSPLEASDGMKSHNGSLTDICSDSEFSKKYLYATCQRTGANATFHISPSKPGEQGIVETIRSKSDTPPTRLFIVVDGSANMAEFAPKLASVLQTIPENVHPQLFFASDEITQLTENGQTFLDSLKALGQAPFIGGPDNAPMLIEALEQAKTQNNSAVLWIHGPQPVCFQSGENRLQFERQLKKNRPPTIYDLQLKPGPNCFRGDFEDLIHFRTIDCKPDSIDLESALAQLTSGKAYYETQFAATTQSGNRITDSAVSTDVRSLWAFAETQKLLLAGDNDSATKLASKHRLVTAVTGAVILENKEQYSQMGLPPDSIGSVNETYRGLHQWFKDDLVGNLWSQLGQLIGKAISELINGWIADTMQLLGGALQLFFIHPKELVDAGYFGNQLRTTVADIQRAIAIAATGICGVLSSVATLNLLRASRREQRRQLAGTILRIAGAAGLIYAIPAALGLELELTGKFTSWITVGSSDEMMLLGGTLATSVRGGILAGVGGIASAFAPVLGRLGLGTFGGEVGEAFAFTGLVAFLCLSAAVLVKLIHVLLLKTVQIILLNFQYISAPSFLLLLADKRSRPVAIAFVKTWIELTLWTLIWIALLQLLMVLLASDWNPWLKVLCAAAVLELMTRAPQALAVVRISPVSEFAFAGLIERGLYNLLTRSLRFVNDAVERKLPKVPTIKDRRFERADAANQNLISN